MTSHQTLIARVALSTVAAVVSVVAVSNRRIQGLSFERLKRLSYWSFAVSRFGLYAVVFLVLHIAARGDVPVYYFPEAAQVMRGLLPYRDFVSSYAPLHPYLDALILRVWFSPQALILWAICVECLVLPLWFRVGKSFLSEHEMRTGAILYVTSAFSIQYVTIDGQDNVILAVLLAAALLLIQRNRAWLSGILVGAGIATVKFLPLIYAPAFFVAIRRRWQWVVAMAIVVGVVYGGFALHHVPLLMPLSEEGSLRSPANLPFILEAVSGVVLPSAIYDGVLLLVLGALTVLTAWTVRDGSDAVRLRALTFCLVAMTIALVLFAKKSWPAYLMLTLFPICALVDSKKVMQTAGFGFLTVVAVTEHSYWAGFIDSIPTADLHVHLVAMHGRYVFFMVLEVLLIIFYGWLLAASVKEILALRARPLRASPNQ